MELHWLLLRTSADQHRSLEFVKMVSPLGVLGRLSWLGQFLTLALSRGSTFRQPNLCCWLRVSPCSVLLVDRLGSLQPTCKMKTVRLQLHHVTPWYQQLRLITCVRNQIQVESLTYDQRVALLSVQVCLNPTNVQSQLLSGNALRDTSNAVARKRPCNTMATTMRLARVTAGCTRMLLEQ